MSIHKYKRNRITVKDRMRANEDIVLVVLAELDGWSYCSDIQEAMAWHGHELTKHNITAILKRLQQQGIVTCRVSHAMGTHFTWNLTADADE